MVTFQKLSVAFLAALASIRVFIERTSNEVRTQERGDVPGWVMLAIMSALLVAGLLAIAGPRLIQLFNQAIDNVAGLG